MSRRATRAEETRGAPPAGLRLGVNVDHVATVRQARGTSYPSPVEVAALCATAGAHGITVHLREDRRHIQDADVEALCADRVLPVNLEMANHPDIVEVALRLRPDEACLVPERREELTTEGGLDAVREREALAGPVRRLAEAGVDVSLFIDPDPEQVETAAALAVPYVELHTGSFCNTTGGEQARELDRLVAAATKAHDLGLRVNAGHGINVQNLTGILDVPHLHTLNIGHSLVARAVYVGMAQAVREMLDAMAAYTGGRRIP